MITVEKLEKGTYFDDAFKISFRYDPTTVAKVKELAERRYLPEDRAWEIPAHELPALIEKVGLSNIKSEEAVVQALNTKEIEDKREATQERLKGIKPVIDFDFKTVPLPHQIEAFNYGMEKNSLLIGDEQGLGKTKESIDICVARKKELIKTLIVCGVNSVKYNWEKEIQIHSNEGCVMVDGKTTLNKASYVFFMDKAWNSGDNAQAEDRAHRIGTVGAVNVISMVAKGTIDEAVEDYLLENKDLIDRVVDGKGSKQDIKTILNKLLSI